MIRKIIFKKRKLLQLITSFTGSAIGLLLLLISVQFYSDIKNMLGSKEDILGAHYLVIRKNVATTSTFTGKFPSFSNEELEEIRSRPFVEEAGEFIPGRFSVYVLFPGLGGENGMQTSAFVESVEDRFIDVKSEEWKWEKGDREIPVILPSAYLDSYNFGFAPGMGLPPVSEAVFKKMKVQIEIEGNKNKGEFIGNITGLSDRINTILVPLDFINYANEVFPDRGATQPSRLILAVKDIHDPALAAFLEEKNYDTNADALRGSRVKSVLEVTLTIFFFLGVVIMFLSIHSFIQYSQIIIAEMNMELRILLLMGYRHRFISGKYIRFYTLLAGALAMLASSVLLVLKRVADSYLQSYNLEGSKSVLPVTWLAGLVFLGMMIAFTSASVHRQVKKLAKNLHGSRG